MNTQNKLLSAPFIPVAEHDGLIKTSDLSDAIEVRVPVWAYSEPGDTYQLLINGLPTGPVRPILSGVQDADAFLLLSINAPTMLMANGWYSIAYRATATLGAVEADSSCTNIYVNRAAPGAALLAPLVFPVLESEATVIAYVPGYAGIAAGDVIKTYCNGTPGPIHDVVSSEVSGVIRIAFPRPFLQKLPTSFAVIDYLITDRAGNTSAKSQPISVTLQI